MTARNIKIATAAFYDIKVSDILGPSRKAVFTQPRQVAMYLCRKYTDMSTPQIGREFGGRDHTTILHGIASVEGRMTAELRMDMNAIMDNVPVLRERQMGGVFRSARSGPPVFKSTRTTEGKNYG